MIKKIVSTFLLLFITITAFSQTFVGDWKGNLQVGHSSLVFIIHLSQENGVWKATADSPDQGAFGIPAKANVNGNGIEVLIEGGISYIGKMERDDLIGGEFQQGTFRAKLDL